MSKATAYNDFRRLPGGRFYTGAPLPWEVGRKGSGLKITIPAGFKFESSVPWWLTWLRPREYRPWLLAAAVHDFLLASGFDKAFAAGEWYRAARARGPNSWLALPAYYGVVIWTVRK